MGYFSAHPAVFIENGCLFQGKCWSLSQQPPEPLSYQKLCVHKVFEAIPTAKRPGIVSCGSDVITFVMSGTHPGSKHWKGRWKLAVALPFSDFSVSVWKTYKQCRLSGVDAPLEGRRRTFGAETGSCNIWNHWKMVSSFQEFKPQGHLTWEWRPITYIPQLKKNGN